MDLLVEIASLKDNGTKHFQCTFIKQEGKIQTKILISIVLNFYPAWNNKMTKKLRDQFKENQLYRELSIYHSQSTTILVRIVIFTVYV